MNGQNVKYLSKKQRELFKTKNELYFVLNV